MSHQWRNRQRRNPRQAPYRDPKPVILVVCEGKNTEPQYLRGFARACCNPRVQIKIHPEVGVPNTLVRMAKDEKNAAIARSRQEKDENAAYDEVWCVFDIDEHPDVAGAKQMAMDNDIEVAISNPSFELWLLLHFREHPGMQGREKLRQLMKEHLGAYDKKVNYDIDYKAGYLEAEKRAHRLDQAAVAAGEPNRNPTSGVYLLTQRIDGKRFGKSDDSSTMKVQDCAVSGEPGDLQ